MTKPWRVDVLECRGSSYDVGKQMAEAFLKTTRGRAYARRKERRPFAFSLRNAEATLKTWAPNIWEELHGLADGLNIPLERAVAEYSNGRLRYPPRGCSAVMSAGLYGRNYDYDVRHYDRILLAVQPKGVHASVGFSDRFTGRVDGMNEHGLCIGLHQVSQATWRPGLVCILIVRIVLDQCATTREAVALLRRTPHGLSFNYSLMDAAGSAAVVEASPAAVVVREGAQLGCSNHFLSPSQQAFNRRNPGSYRHLPALEKFAGERLAADKLFKALNDSLSPVFDHRYSGGSGTLHTIVCTPAERRLLIGVGGDATADSIDFGSWVRGRPLGLEALTGQLGGTAKPFDPGRRVIAKAEGPAKVFIGALLDNALFKGVTLANASFENVSLAGARFDDIDFSNTVITSNCNFNGMQIAGVGVKELLAAYAQRRPQEQGMRIAVIGGGIGGLSAALHLLKAGLDVHVYEQSPRIGEIGAGIQISPNASRLLVRLGLKPAMDRVGVRPAAVNQRRWDDGRTLQRAPLGPEVETAFGAPYYHFHRGDLAELLGGAMPAERLHVGHKLVDLEQKGERVIAHFENGTSIEADLLVGADGIRSRVRQLAFGAEKPRFTGCVAWRGLVPAERIGHLGIEVASHNWMGPDGHVVHYWVASRQFMNVVCVTEHGTWTDESWTTKGDVAEALARYDGWHPTVRGLIQAFPETFVWALHDRLPLPRWTDGRVTLLGDACHPMLPFMAQGAAQSIEDGAALASLLMTMPGDVAGALKSYEEIRKPRATRLQEASAANRTRFHLADGPEQQKRDETMAASGDRSIANIGWLYMHDAAMVPKAES